MISQLSYPLIQPQDNILQVHDCSLADHMHKLASQKQISVHQISSARTPFYYNSGTKPIVQLTSLDTNHDICKCVNNHLLMA